jgi:hypothetical protein
MRSIQLTDHVCPRPSSRGSAVNGAADRCHLQLDGVEPQLLYRASAANAAVADESDRLVAPFSVGVVERILQNRGRSAIVFGSREDHQLDDVAVLASWVCPAARPWHVRLRLRDFEGESVVSFVCFRLSIDRVQQLNRLRPLRQLMALAVPARVALALN